MAEYTEEELNNLMFKALVPKGLMPETNEDIDAMLDAIGEENLSEETVQRMLRKINGEEPLRDPTENNTYRLDDETMNELSERELALYRNRDDDIPPEIKKMLSDMEEEALEDGEEDDAEGDSRSSDE